MLTFIKWYLIVNVLCLIAFLVMICYDRIKYGAWGVVEEETNDV